MQIFPRGTSALSVIFNAIVDHILYVKGHVLENLNAQWLSREHVRMYCQSISGKGSPYPRCFGFLDGTIRANCRPSFHQREVNHFLFLLLEHSQKSRLRFRNYFLN